MMSDLHILTFEMGNVTLQIKFYMWRYFNDEKFYYDQRKATCRLVPPCAGARARVGARTRVFPCEHAASAARSLRVGGDPLAFYSCD